MEDRLPRKLAAILYADVAGYSRLTGEDEDATHRRLSEYLDQIAVTIERHGGRVMHYAGDAVLAMFEAVVDALSCAAQVQNELKTRNEDLPDERKVQFRIGVNLGDVIEDRDDIYGDGVNVAARLEGLAEPGGICISESVHTAVGNKLPFHYEFLGEQEVKNIVKPVKAYHARLKPDAVLPEPRGTPRKGKRMQRPVVAAVVVLLVVVGGALTWLKPWEPREEPASIERMAFPLPDKPSIAVLAFENLTGDAAQEYLSDGISENIITELSRFKQFFVVARQSSFSYKGKPVEVRQVGRELGVRYVLEGSVHTSGNKLRVTAQLINTMDGNHLWAERYDRERKDIFAVQDEITRTIVATLAENIDLAEYERTRSKPPQSLTAYELWARGETQWLTFTKGGNEQARQLYERARKLDPGYAEAYAGLAWVHINGYRWGWSETLSRDESLTLALEMARKAVELAPFNHYSHWALANALMQSGQIEQALVEYDRALERNPNDASLLADSAEPLVYAGRPKEAVVRMKTAVRLNPYHPDWYLWTLGWAQYFGGDYEEALASLKKMSQMPNLARRSLATTYVRLGRLEEARAVVAEFLKNDPDYTLEKLRLNIKGKFINPADEKRLIDDLRKAGLPE